MKRQQKITGWRRPLLRFVAGFCFAGVLTSISYALYSPNGMADAFRESVEVSIIAGIIVGTLSACSDRILEFFGRFFAEFFP